MFLLSRSCLILKIVTRLLFLVSFLIAEGNYHRCGFIGQSQRGRENEERPTLDKFIDDGPFRIHYNEEGEHAPINAKMSMRSVGFVSEVA